MLRGGLVVQTHIPRGLTAQDGPGGWGGAEFTKTILMDAVWPGHVLRTLLARDDTIHLPSSLQIALCLNIFAAGEDAYFSVKDGSGCSSGGTYTVTTETASGSSSTVSASCAGPANYCAGNNRKECLWTVPTPACAGTCRFRDIGIRVY